RVDHVRPEGAEHEEEAEQALQVLPGANRPGHRYWHCPNPLLTRASLHPLARARDDRDVKAPRAHQPELVPQEAGGDRVGNDVDKLGCFHGVYATAYVGL